jgi:hypothetical protein
MGFSQNAVRGTALAALAIVGLVASAAARTPTARNFDGVWSVVIVTTRGDCERAYRYPVAIAGTSVINAGDAAVDISGTVRGNGTVAVRVSAGGQSANGFGRLTTRSGSGSWSGGACAGVWTAERRPSYRASY